MAVLARHGRGVVGDWVAVGTGHSRGRLVGGAGLALGWGMSVRIGRSSKMGGRKEEREHTAINGRRKSDSDEKSNGGESELHYVVCLVIPWENENVGISCLCRKGVDKGRPATTAKD